MAAKKPAMSPTDISPAQVLGRVEGPRQEEAHQLLTLHQQVSGEQPLVWANRIIGFGQYRYRYDSGHGGTAPLLGFASNSTKHTIYLDPDTLVKRRDLLDQLGPHKVSKTCLYLTRLSKINLEILEELLKQSLAATRAADFTVG